MLKKFRELALLIWIASAIISQGVCADDSSEFQTQRAMELLNKSSDIYNTYKYERYADKTGVDYDLQMDRLELSLRLVEEAIELDENISKAWEQKGDILDSLERYEDAIECYDRLLEEDPGQKEIWKKKGNDSEILGKIEDALQCYRMIFSCPQNSMSELNLYDEDIEELAEEGNIWYRMGYYYYLLDEEENSLDCYNRSIESYNKANASGQHSYDLGWSWMGMGQSSLNMSQYNESIKCLEIAISNFTAWNDPSPSSWAWYYMGLAELGIAGNMSDNESAIIHYEKAENCFERMIEIDENSPYNSSWSGYYGKWMALRSIPGRDKEEDEAFTKAISLVGGTRIPLLEKLIERLQNYIT